MSLTIHSPDSLSLSFTLANNAFCCRATTYCLRRRPYPVSPLNPLPSQPYGPLPTPIVIAPTLSPTPVATLTSPSTLPSRIGSNDSIRSIYKLAQIGRFL